MDLSALNEDFDEQVRIIDNMKVSDKEKTELREKAYLWYLDGRREVVQLSEAHWKSHDEKDIYFLNSCQHFGSLTLKAAYLSNVGLISALAAFSPEKLEGSVFAFLLGILFAFAATGLAYLSQYQFSASIQSTKKKIGHPYIIEEDDTAESYRKKGAGLIVVAILTGIMSFASLAYGIYQIHSSSNSQTWCIPSTDCKVKIVIS